MSTENLASIYYGFVIEDNDILFNANKEAVERFIDDDWYIGEHYGQGFYYHSWEFDSPLVLGVECYETDDVLDFTPFDIAKITSTKDGLKEIYKELFPNKEVPEPRFLLIQRQF